ncbi:MAG: cytochrome c [bacterium]|nr:cytochrome c [bacterium]
MNRSVALIVVFVFGALLPVALVLLWLSRPVLVPLSPLPRVAPIPQHLLPKVRLPAANDAESVALRRSIRNGERIYQRLCFHCHGRAGKGDGNPYMESIGHKPADHSDLAKMQKLSDWEFFLALRDGVKDKRGWFTMPPWQSVLTPQEMWDVITYVRRLPTAS